MVFVERVKSRSKVIWSYKGNYHVSGHFFSPSSFSTTTAESAAAAAPEAAGAAIDEIARIERLIKEDEGVLTNYPEGSPMQGFITVRDRLAQNRIILGQLQMGSTATLYSSTDAKVGEDPLGIDVMERRLTALYNITNRLKISYKMGEVGLKSFNYFVERGQLISMSVKLAQLYPKYWKHETMAKLETYEEDETMLTNRNNNMSFY
jgi:hypothetical protein